MEQNVEAPGIVGPWSNWDFRDGAAYDQHRQDRQLGLDAHRWRTRREKGKANTRRRRLYYGDWQHRRGIAGVKLRNRHMYRSAGGWNTHIPRYRRRLTDEERRAQLWGDYIDTMGYA